MESYEERAREFSYRVYSLPLDVTGVSIRSHAKDIGVSAKTYSGWMEGTGNTSYIWTAMQSFSALGINPLYYYGSYMHPEIRNIIGKPSLSEQKLALKLFLSDTTEEEIQLIYYLKYHNGISEWRRILRTCVADAHLPMDDRVKSTTYLCHMYKNSETAGDLSWNCCIQPNDSLVNSAAMIGHRAVLGGVSGYVGVPSDRDYYAPLISNIIRFCREKSGKSKEGIAAAARCRVETLNNYESGASYPNFFRLTEIIRATGMPIFEILYGVMYQNSMGLSSVGSVSTERMRLISDVDTDEERDVTLLAFLILGQHGGSWHCYLHKMAMLVSLPDRQQNDFADFVDVSYKMDAYMGRIVCKNQADPMLDR